MGTKRRSFLPFLSFLSFFSFLPLESFQSFLTFLSFHTGKTFQSFLTFLSFLSFQACLALSGPAGRGCGALFLLRPSPRACKKQTAAPAPLRLSRPLDAPQLRSPVNVGGRNL